MRKYINIVETFENPEKRYWEEAKYWVQEIDKYIPVPEDLMLSYKDGTQTSTTQSNLFGNIDEWRWEQDGWLHRDDDKPALITAQGMLYWFFHGEKDRKNDKPAVIDVSKAIPILQWWKNGFLHRDDDKPAIIKSNGYLAWYKNGKNHRDDDKPAEIFPSRGMNWLKNNKLHRFNGPAIIDPRRKPSWYWRGEYIPVESQEEFIEYLKKHKGLQRFRVNKP